MTQPANFTKSIVTVTPKKPDVKSVSVSCSHTPNDALVVSDLSWPRVFVTFRSNSRSARGSVLVPREQMIEFCRAVIRAIEDTPVDEESTDE